MTSIPRQPVSVSSITSRYQPAGEHPPRRSDRSQAGMTSETHSNDTTGSNTSVCIPVLVRHVPPDH